MSEAAFLPLARHCLKITSLDISGTTVEGVPEFRCALWRFPGSLIVGVACKFIKVARERQCLVNAIKGLYR